MPSTRAEVVIEPFVRTASVIARRAVIPFVRSASLKTIPVRPAWSPRRRGRRFASSPTAWAKIRFLRDLGPTEVGGFGISTDDDLLLVEDVRLVQHAADHSRFSSMTQPWPTTSMRWPKPVFHRELCPYLDPHASRGLARAKPDGPADLCDVFWPMRLERDDDPCRDGLHLRSPAVPNWSRRLHRSDDRVTSINPLMDPIKTLGFKSTSSWSKSSRTTTANHRAQRQRSLPPDSRLRSDRSGRGRALV